MNKIFVGIIVAVALLAAGTFIFRGGQGVGGERLVIIGFVDSTPASTSVGVASTAVLSMTPASTYGRIVNNGTQAVSCSVGTAAVLNGGLKINSSTDLRTLEFGVNHIPAAGTVNCIASATTSVDTLIGI